MITTDLESWLAGLGIGFATPAALAGDLSQRRYFRVVLDDGMQVLAAYYPESLRPAMARFVGARSLLADAGVRVPEIRQWSSERGWMLVEDLGTATLFEQADLPPQQRVARFLTSVESAGRIAGLDAEEVARLGSPALDEALLRRELEPTIEFLLDPRGLAALPARRRELLAALDELCSRLGGGRLVPCHRDFMARNLIPRDEGIAVIDFQDLRLGPPAYDIASLLNDSFFPERALEEVLLPDRWRTGTVAEEYSRAVVQRTLKASGTFARFAVQGNPRHVPLIAPTLARAARHLESLPETKAVFGALRGWWRAQLTGPAIC
ncbi:MAG: phosphotransferase [Thermoanaerobaculia bacterium]